MTSLNRVGIVFVLTLGSLSACSTRSTGLSNEYSRMDLPAGEPLCITTNSLTERCLVSLHSLVTTPEKYHRRPVQTVGFVTLGFESNVLYLSRDSFSIGDSHSAVWLDVAGLQLTNPGKYDRRYVVVAGIFDAENRGHLGGFSGTIEGIFRFDPLR